MNIQRSIGKVFISEYGTSIISFVAIVIFARELSASELGIFFLYQMLINILAIPGSFGRGNALIKRLSEGENPRNILSTSIAFFIISSTTLVILILATKGYINTYVGAKVGLLVAIGIVLRSLYTLPLNILKGELRVGETATLQLCQRGTWFIISYSLLIYGFGYSSLIYGLLLGYLIGSIFGIYKINTGFGRITWRSAISLFDYWKYTTFSFVGSTIHSWMDIAVIGYFLSQRYVGIYELSWRVSIIVALASSAIGSTILPQISAWNSSNSKAKIVDLFPNALFSAVFLTTPAFFGVLLLSEPVLGLIFGSEYREGSFVLIVLVLSKILESIDNILKSFIEGINLPNLRMRAVLVSIIVNLLLNIVLISAYGLIGAAIATTTALIVNSLITVYYLSHYVELDLPYKELSWCFFSSLGMFIMLYLIVSRVEINNIVLLLTIVLVGMAVYFGLVLTYQPIRAKIINNLTKLLKQ